MGSNFRRGLIRIMSVALDTTKPATATTKEPEQTSVLGSTAYWLGQAIIGSGAATYIANGRKVNATRFLCTILKQESLSNTFGLLIFHINKLIELKSKDAAKITKFTESAAVYAFYSIARKVYPVQAHKIDHGVALKDDEIITSEKLIADILQYLFDAIVPDFLAIDEAVHNKAPITKKLFANLAEKILNILLPPDNAGRLQSLINRGIRAVIQDLIVDGLYIFYKTYVYDDLQLPTTETEQKGLEDAFKPILSIVIGAVSRSISQSIVAKHDPKVAQSIEVVAEPLMVSYGQWIAKSHPILENMDAKDLTLIIKALLVKMIGNVSQHQPTLSTDSPVEAGWHQLVNFLRMSIYKSFQKINIKIAQNQKVDSSDFYECVQGVLSGLLAQDQALSQFIWRRFPIITTFLAKHLMEFYQALHKDDRLAFEQRLRKCLWDPTEFLKMHPTIPKAFDEPNEQTSEYFGSENFLRNIKYLTEHLTHIALKAIDKQLFTVTQAEPLANKIGQLLGLQSHEEVTPAIRGILQVFSRVDIPNDQVRQFLKTHISNMLFRCMVILFEKGAKLGGGKDRILFNAVKVVLDIVKVHAENIEKKMRPTAAAPNTAEQLQAFRALSCDIFNLFSLENELPMPRALATQLINLCKERFVPMFLMSLYNDFHEWMFLKDTHREQLHKLYNSHRVSETAIGLGIYVEQFVPWFFRSQPALTAEYVIDALRPLLLRSPDELLAQEVKLQVDDDAPLEQFRKQLTLGVELIGSLKDESIAIPFAFVRNYVEAFLLKLFLNVSKSFENMELDHLKQSKTRFFEGSALLRAAMELINQVRDHFKEVNGVTKELGIKRASRVPDETMRQHFQSKNKLHPAMNTDDLALSKEYFHALTKKLVPLMKFDENVGLPAHPIFKQALWYIFEAELFPLTLKAVLYEVVAPHALHYYLSSLLTSINSPLASADRIEGPVDHDPIPDDSLQRNLQSILGECLQHIIGLQPTLVGQQLMKYRHFRENAGRAVGRALRPMMEQQTVLASVHQVISVLLPNLCGGGWVTQQVDKACKETKEVPRIDPNSTGDIFYPIKTENNTKVYGWDFGFPQNPQDMPAIMHKLEQERQEARAHVRQQLGGMIEYQGGLSLDAAMHGLWNEFQNAFDKAMHDVLGKPGEKLKQNLDKLCRFIWKNILLPIFKILFYPLRQLTAFIMRKYFSNQADMRMEDIVSPIHQNFMYLAIDSILNVFLERDRKAHPAPAR